MAALLHLKVVRATENKENVDDNLLFSDVPLGQTKARTQPMLQGFPIGFDGIKMVCLHYRFSQRKILFVTCFLAQKFIKD